MSRKVHVAGVGMVPFTKPGASDPYPLLGASAIKAALADAGMDYQSVDQVYAGFVYGDSCSGQAAAYHVGLTGIPIVNVNNNCATGSTALWLGRQAIASGEAECVLVVGFEQMQRGAIAAQFTDRPDPSQRLLDVMAQTQGRDDVAPIAAQLFGGAGRMHMQLYGTRADTFARIAVKARRHAADNPNAIFRTPLTLGEVLASPAVFDPSTVLPAELRRCCGRPVLRGLREEARAQPPRGHRGAGARDRRQQQLRRERHAQAGRLRHDAPRGAARVRTVWHRAG